MSDEASLDEGQAPAPEATQHDWEKDYKELQAEYTRSQQALKDEQAAWADEQALLARIQEKHPHLIADGEDDLDDEDDDEIEPERAEPKPDPRVDNLVQWQAEQQFERDLTKFIAGRELTDKGRKVIEALTQQGGNNPKALEAAVNEWFEISPVEEEKPKRKAPHVLAGGTTATDVPDFSDMTRDQVDQWMIDRARALEAQT